MSFSSVNSSSSANSITSSKRRSGLARREAHHHPVEDDVVVRGELLVEADPELDERGHAPRDPDPPGVGAIDARRAASAACSCRTRCGRRCRRTRLRRPRSRSLERLAARGTPAREKAHRPLLERVDALGRDSERLRQRADLDREVAAGGLRDLERALGCAGGCLGGHGSHVEGSGSGLRRHVSLPTARGAERRPRPAARAGAGAGSGASGARSDARRAVRSRPRAGARSSTAAG